jgi:hypothetical protein
MMYMNMSIKAWRRHTDENLEARRQDVQEGIPFRDIEVEPEVSEYEDVSECETFSDDRSFSSIDSSSNADSSEDSGDSEEG